MTKWWQQQRKHFKSIFAKIQTLRPYVKSRKQSTPSRTSDSSSKNKSNLQTCNLLWIFKTGHSLQYYRHKQPMAVRERTRQWWSAPSLCQTQLFPISPLRASLLECFLEFLGVKLILKVPMEERRHKKDESDFRTPEEFPSKAQHETDDRATVSPHYLSAHMSDHLLIVKPRPWKNSWQVGENIKRRIKDPVYISF